MSMEATILIAEDDDGHFALVKKNLWRSCAAREIIHFRDGSEIMDFLFPGDDSSGITFDRNYLILLDIRLPKVDGLEILRQVKQTPELSKIPIIMLTTSADDKDVNRCYELGCSGYIIKPCDYTDFMEAIESLGNLLSMDEYKWPEIRAV